jgi:hypothetical protein
MKWLLARLKEKSTWLGIFTIAGLFGMKIEPELREHIINAILAVAAVVAFVFREDVKRADLPPIELQGRADTSAPDSPVAPPAAAFRRYRDRDDDGMQSELPTRSGTQQSDGWNG